MRDLIVYQVSAEPIARENYLDEKSIKYINQRDCQRCEAVHGEAVDSLLDQLVNNILPDGMFTKVDGRTLRYNGGMEAWNREYYQRVKEMASAAGQYACNYLFESLQDLEEYIVNPLHTSARFYIQEDGTKVTPYRSMDFMWWVNTLEPGAEIHVGAVICCYY